MVDTITKPRFDLGLTVFFPCYNEEANIERVTYKTIEVLEDLVADWEIILVNDGSRDRTGELADSLAAQDARVRAVHHAKNGGYGAALRSGFKSATKPYIFFTDGDGQFDIRELGKLLENRDKADILCGWRRNRQDKLIRKINSACWAWLVQRVLKFRCRDVDGAFKLFPRKLFERIELKSSGAMISAEILARAAHLGYTNHCLPVTHLPRTAGAATGAKLSVIFRAFGELLRLRKDILHSPRE
jgi:glycosyltransferase involved in cell wall biosynthesis